MSGQGDDRGRRALHAALASQPKDILGLLDAMRDSMREALGMREGVVHALLHRELREKRIVVGGFSDRGLPLYRLPDIPPAGGPDERVLPGPLAEHVARTALRVASGARDPSDRGRIQADVIAHLDALGDKSHRFGSARAIRGLVRRVDRDKAAVCLPIGGGDVLMRFALHEGPWLLGAVLLYFLLKAFVVQPYVIPSGSMRPTLVEDDRVVVFLIGRDPIPNRGDIVVYERGDRTYVKRLIGLPGERIELRYGDVYINGELLVKPDDLRLALRSELHRWAFDDGDPRGWKSTVGEAGGAGTSAWRWQSHGFAPHGSKAKRGNSYALRDGYLVLDAERGRRGSIRLALLRGPSRGPAARFALEVGVQGIVLKEEKLVDGELVESTRLEVAPKTMPTGALQMELSYVDGILRARCADWSYAAARRPTGIAGKLMPEVSVAGGDTRPVTLRLDRDLHYANLGNHGVPMGAEREPNPHTVGPQALFLMGDNTTDSVDSRYSEVGDIPVKSVVGPVHVRIWPPSRIGGVR